MATLPPSEYDGKAMLCDVDFAYTASEIPEDLTCKICATPWVQPLEISPCQHVYCFACCKRLLGKKKECPECRGAIAGLQPPNRVLASLVDALEVRCLKCGVVGPRGHYVTHECAPRSNFLVAAEWAQVLSAKGRHDEAVRVLSPHIEEFEAIPKNKDKKKKAAEAASAFVGRARAYAALGNWKLCQDDAATAVMHDETVGEAYYLRAASSRALACCSAEEILADLETALMRDATLQQAKELRGQIIPKGSAPSSPSTAAATQAAVAAPPASGIPAAASAPAHVDPQPPAPAEPHRRGRPEHVIQNTLSILMQYWTQHGDAFRKWFASRSRKQREDFIRTVEPLIVERPGNTMDRNGEDLHEVVYLASEINLSGICSTDDGLVLLFESIAGSKKQFDSIIMDAVRTIMEALREAGPRQKYLASQDDSKERLVVEARTGIVCDTKVTASSQQEFERIVAQMSRRRESFEWIPMYVRSLALDRIALIAELLLRIVIQFMTERDLAVTIPFRNIFGCLNCGKKKPPGSNGSDDGLVACKTCRLARYCKDSCLSAHASSGHELICRLEMKNTLHATLHENLNRSLEEETVHDPSFAIIRQMCNESVNRSDPFGNGDQSPVPMSMDPRGKMQQLRTMWASGADFNPRSPFAKSSKFFNACFEGNEVAVEKAIKESTNKFELMNRRETLMRFSPLLSCIAGARGKDILGGGDFLAIAKMLIENGSDVNAKDMCGFSCVHHCCTAYASIHSLEILPLLIAKGANPNERNRFDETPILEPTMASKSEVLRSLLQAGADPNLLACHGTVSAGTLSLMSPEIHSLLMQGAPNVGLKVGEKVMLRGLVNKPHLNGKVGTIAEIQVGKYVLDLDDDGGKIVSKFDNVTRVTASSDGCAACKKIVREMKRCARCKNVMYCCEACQKSHWPQHKSSCKAVEAVLVSPPAKNQNLAMVDLTAGITRSPGNAKASSWPAGNFIVKVQVPMDLSTRKPHRQGQIMIYDERHSFEWMIEPKEQPAAFEALFSVVSREGVNGLKAYMLASSTNMGQLAIVPKTMALQPW